MVLEWFGFYRKGYLRWIDATTRRPARRPDVRATRSNGDAAAGAGD